MKIKVCGMRDVDNIHAVAQLGIDLMGFIFSPKSPRYVEQVPARTEADKNICRVGVFVNAKEEDIKWRVRSFDLDYIQLHGSESRTTCLQIREDLEKAGKCVKLIKAICVKDVSDVQEYKDYIGAVDYLLFDTKCKTMGGSGMQFDWSVLDAYDGDIPFLLSGGIGPNDVAKVKQFHHPKCIGIDLNSKFEIAPALKDVDKLRSFIQQLTLQ